MLEKSIDKHEKRVIIESETGREKENADAFTKENP